MRWRGYVAASIAKLRMRDATNLFIIEAPGFHPDLIPGVLWMIFMWCGPCGNDVTGTGCLESFMHPNHYSDDSSTELQRKFDLVMCLLRFEIRYPAWLKPHAFLQYLDLQASDARLAALRDTIFNFSVLRYVAHGLFTHTKMSDSVEEWVNFGVEILKNAAEPWSLLIDKEKVLNARPVLYVMCFDILGTPFRGHCLDDLRANLKHIQMWARMISQAGIDLGQYGAQEAEAWDSRPDHDSTRYRLLYGPTPEDWSIERRATYRKVATFGLQDPPGSYPRWRDERVPTKICWIPSTKEWTEGTWTKLEYILVRTQPKTMENRISELEKLQVEVFPELLLHHRSEDDAGAIALLQLRSSRWEKSIPRRSHSQPCLITRRRDTSGAYSRDWLSACHLCPSDCTWKLGYHSCGGPGYLGGPASCFLRDESITKRQRSVQQSEHWFRNSFLREISECNKFDILHWTELFPAGHTGDVDCPWKCGTVKLDRLQVPEELRPYHPKDVQRSVLKFT